MATTKTLTPTNQAITLAAFTEKPDNRTNVTNDDKLADAVNTLNSKIENIGKLLYTNRIDTDTSNVSCPGIMNYHVYACKIDSSYSGGSAIGIRTGTSDVITFTGVSRSAGANAISLIYLKISTDMIKNIVTGNSESLIGANAVGISNIYGVA